ncbi:transporter with conserved Zn ribbon C11C7 [Cryptosporidium sp. chipmunk genotype I]|uniref:transporter with conserved Zn ribbon C11C7 n=1 Tax=Cryptosporidium sp. chipmunk genotype I TaxID=1280935 RepID=UPI003519D8F5|nr:transporter with conserved Zn ribbon C11C7 [Cryptosporidium sp. chipmunk genotype I]
MNSSGRELLLGDGENEQSQIITLIKSGANSFKEGVIKPCRENFFLIVCMISLLISSVFNSVLFKKMTSAMPNHVWFLTQLTSTLYIPLFGLVLLISYFRGELSRECLEFPMSKFWMMGFFDASSSILTLLASTHTSGVMQVVLGQMCTPITLVMLSSICKDRFHKLQYIGAIIMVMGIFIVKSTLILGLREGGGAEKSNRLIFNVLFVIACIPASASSVYKDLSFREYSSLNENYLQFCVAATQVIIGFFLVPINSLSILGPQKIEMNKISSLLFDGAKCLFLKKNLVTDDCGEELQRPCDDCSAVQFPVLMYFIANVVCNVFSVLVLKYGTASTGFIVSTLRLPVTTLVFFSPILVGKEATEPKVEDLIGILVLILGLVLYRLGSVKINQEEEERHAEEEPERDYYELSSMTYSKEAIDKMKSNTSSTTCSFNIEYDSSHFHSS